MIRHAWPDLVDDDLDDTLRVQLRAAVFGLARLPPRHQADRQAVVRTRARDHDSDDQDAGREAGGHVQAQHAARHRRPGRRRPAGRWLDRQARARCGADRRGALRARTIHAVKGESCDATFTVAIKTDRFDNVADWLTGGEERRIAYVALTRAKSYSAMAVPDGCDSDDVARA